MIYLWFNANIDRNPEKIPLECVMVCMWLGLFKIHADLILGYIFFWGGEFSRDKGF